MIRSCIGPDVDEVLPVFDGEWEAFPPRMKQESKFTPKKENCPIGNTADFSNFTLSKIWLKMFHDPLKISLRCTNKKGARLFGYKWTPVDMITFILFHCALMHMSIVRRPVLRDYFRKCAGDEAVKRFISRNQFERIYSAFSLYDPDDAAQSGASDKAKKETYHSLFKCQPVWKAAILGFQKMWTPGVYLSLDESMSKYHVTMFHHSLWSCSMTCSTRSFAGSLPTYSNSEAQTRSALHTSFPCSSFSSRDRHADFNSSSFSRNWFV